MREIEQIRGVLFVHFYKKGRYFANNQTKINKL